MIPEKQFKKNLLFKLNAINSGWIDGDKDLKRKHKADIVNHSLMVAIEIKDDTKHKINSGMLVENSQDLTIMNKRLSDDIRSANKKFKSYPNYKTILLFRTGFFMVDIFRYALEGLHAYSSPRDKNGKLRYVGRATKYSAFIRKEIGCFIIYVYSEKGWYYIPNKLAEPQRVLDKEKIENLFNLKLENVKQI